LLSSYRLKLEMYEKGIGKGSLEFIGSSTSLISFGAGESRDLAQDLLFIVDATRWIMEYIVTMERGGFLLQGHITMN